MPEPSARRPLEYIAAGNAGFISGAVLIGSGLISLSILVGRN